MVSFNAHRYRQDKLEQPISDVETLTGWDFLPLREVFHPVFVPTEFDRDALPTHWRGYVILWQLASPGTALVVHRRWAHHLVSTLVGDRVVATCAEVGNAGVVPVASVHCPTQWTDDCLFEACLRRSKRFRSGGFEGQAKALAPSLPGQIWTTGSSTSLPLTLTCGLSDLAQSSEGPRSVPAFRGSRPTLGADQGLRRQIGSEAGGASAWPRPLPDGTAWCQGGWPRRKVEQGSLPKRALAPARSVHRCWAPQVSANSAFLRNL